MPNAQPQYIAIDLKSFFASVECVERNLNPLSTNLVVADNSRTDKTICLAVSPSLKAYGIGGRARLFEVVDFGWHFAFSGYGDEFVHCRKQPIPLITHMADIHAATFARFPCQRDQLRRFGKGGGWIDEAGANAHCTLIHRMAHKAEFAAKGVRLTDPGALKYGGDK